jgi:hypothetical protein
MSGLSLVPWPPTPEISMQQRVRAVPHRAGTCSCCSRDDFNFPLSVAALMKASQSSSDRKFLTVNTGGSMFRM